MRIRQYSFLLILLLFTPPLYAQLVFRCKMPDGKMVIRDIPCEGRDVKTEAVHYSRQISEEEAHATRATLNNQLRNVRNLQRINPDRSHKAQQRAAQDEATEAALEAVRARQEAAEAAARRAQQEAEAARRRKASLKCTPTVINGKYDNCGNFYAPGGGGTTFRQDGKVCQQIGDMVQCH